ncbi:uncharacterized protein N7469_011540 [Penicillium citrinum]|uniref:Uncharacterized protein n=1 Tax=Penicillium citrinum TaxID=5077 RepID=A0A9W9NB80_PENCI|nr:uncharacterized protein N7469_011540 [Penicillium citrinum]KAJ5216675.1 hypothetical protein N7469_011540 [Penicillium citrinum]
MKSFGIVTLAALLPVALAKPRTPPAGMEEHCKQKGNDQTVEYSEKQNQWICVTSAQSDICGPEQDQSTWHKNPTTGEYGCCDKGEGWVVDEKHKKQGSCCAQGSIYSFDASSGKGACCDDGKVFKSGSCIVPGGIEKPVPSGTCGAYLKDARLESLLRTLLVPCFPYGQETLNVFIEYYISILHGGLDLIEIIYKNDCNDPRPSPSPGPKPKPHPWWKCGNTEACRWISLETNDVKKSLPATGATTKAQLPNPNVAKADYEYPFDVWLTKSPDDDLDVYIKGKKIQPQASGTSYLIPGGTKAKDVKYSSSKGIQINFYGKCTEDTPCIGKSVEPWTKKVVYPPPGKDDLDIDVSKYDFDFIFTMTDDSITTEQYTVYADGEKVGMTHGRLTLGDDKYNTDHINTQQVGLAPYVVANDGFWGSYRISKDTQKITVKMTDREAAYPTDEWSYRIDKLCEC